jgi:nicotinamide mononucleotide transporter
MGIDWIQYHWLELVGTLLSLVYLYLSVRENIWLWVTGFVSSFLYMVVFFKEHLYADMGLQVYYLLISVYGWFAWKWGRKKSGRPKMPVRRVGAGTGIMLVLAGGLIYLFVAEALLKLPGILDIPASELPYWDAFTTTGGIVATWMLTRKMIEQWLVWVVVDLVSCGMYLYKGLEVTVVLYVVYTVVAVLGYREWLKKLVINNE